MGVLSGKISGVVQTIVSGVKDKAPSADAVAAVTDWLQTQVTALENIVASDSESAAPTVTQGPEFGRDAAVALADMLTRQWDAVEWRAGETVALGALRLTTAHKNWNNSISLKVHRCTTAGTTGVSEPTWATTAGNTTSDGSAVWTAYPAYFFDSDNGNDTTGDGSQVTPWKTFAKLTVYGGGAILRSGNAVFLKRGTTLAYSGTQPSITRTQVIQVERDGGDTADVRRYIGAWGFGSRPVLDATGIQYGIRFQTTNATTIGCKTTIADLVITGADTDTTPGDGVPGAGICAPADTSARNTGLKVFRCKIYDITNTAAQSTAATDDFVGITATGIGTVLVDNDIHDIDDDGIWIDAETDTMILLNRVHDVCKAFSRVGRPNGDCLQFSNTGAVNNVSILRNLLDHRGEARKHCLIANPAVASTGWLIEGNTFITATDTGTAHNHMPMYLARMSGVIRNNHIHSNALRHSGGGYCLIAGKMRIEGNMVWLRNAGAGFILTASGDAGNPDASGSVVAHNTITGLGTPGAYGVDVQPVVTGELIYNNAIINCTLGVSYSGAGIMGPHAFQNCVTTYTGTPTRDGSDVTGTTLYDIASKPIRDSAVVGAGRPYLPDYVISASGEYMASPPTIGAYEPAVVAGSGIGASQLDLTVTAILAQLSTQAATIAAQAAKIAALEAAIGSSSPSLPTVSVAVSVDDYTVSAQQVVTITAPTLTGGSPDASVTNEFYEIQSGGQTLQTITKTGATNTFTVSNAWSGYVLVVKYTATHVAGPVYSTTASITVAAAVSLQISPLNTPLALQVNVALSPTSMAIASGGTAPYTYSISPSVGAYGLSFNTSTASLSGTPNQQLASTQFTVTVTDNVAATQQTVVTISIAAAASNMPTVQQAVNAQRPLSDYAGEELYILCLGNATRIHTVPDSTQLDTGITYTGTVAGSNVRWGRCPDPLGVQYQGAVRPVFRHAKLKTDPLWAGTLHKVDFKDQDSASRTTIGNTYWTGLEIYLPANTQTANEDIIFWDLHCGPPVGSYSGLLGGKNKITAFNPADQRTGQNWYQDFPAGSYQDRWLKIVSKLKMTPVSGAGTTWTVWLDGTQMISTDGRTVEPDDEAAYWMLGVLYMEFADPAKTYHNLFIRSMLRPILDTGQTEAQIRAMLV